MYWSIGDTISLYEDKILHCKHTVIQYAACYLSVCLFVCLSNISLYYIITLLLLWQKRISTRVYGAMMMSVARLVAGLKVST